MTQLIGLKELQTNTRRIREAAERGEDFVVLYRSKPVFEIKPLSDIEKQLLGPAAKKFNTEQTASAARNTRVDIWNVLTVQDVIDAVKTIVKKHIKGNCMLYLFGSQADGTSHERSDVDIGVLADQKIPVHVLFAINEDIECIPTLRSVDFVDLRSMSEKFMKSVLEKGKKL